MKATSCLLKIQLIFLLAFLPGLYAYGQCDDIGLDISVRNQCLTNIEIEAATYTYTSNLIYTWYIDGQPYPSSDQFLDIYWPESQTYFHYQNSEISLIAEQPEAGCSWEATTYTDIYPPPYASISTNSPVCEGEELLIYTGSQDIDSYNWSGPNSTRDLSSYTDTIKIESVTLDDRGMYYLDAASINGCFEQFNTIVEVNPAPSLTASSNSPVCTGEDLNLSANSIPGATYTWKGPGGYSTQSASSSITSTTLAHSGEYILEAKVGGCPRISDTIEVVVNNITSADISEDTIETCSNAVTLNANPPGLNETGQWTTPVTGVSFDSDIHSANVTVTDIPEGEHWFFWNINGSSGLCTPSKDSVQVKTSEGSKLLTATLTSYNMCQGDNTPSYTVSTVNAGNSPAYAWTLNGNPTGTDSPDYSPDASELLTGTNTIEVNVTSSESCISNLNNDTTASTTLTVYKTPSLTITPSDPVCAPNTADITTSWIDDNSTSPAVTFWEDSDAVTPLSTPTAVTKSGTFYVKANNNGCTDIQPVNVTVHETPSLTITPPDPVCAPNTADITTSWTDDNSTTPAVTFWEDSDAVTTLSTPTAVADSGTFYVKADNNGCTDVEPVNVIVNKQPTANIAGGGVFCKQESGSIEFNLSGSAPWTISYVDADGIAKKETATNSPHIITTNAEGIYTLEGIEDGNGCTNTASGEESVTIYSDLSVGPATTICDYATSELTISFEISKGDSNYTVTGENGGSISEGIYTSKPISATDITSFSFMVSDGSGCPENTDLEVSGTRKCSCPVDGTLTSAPPSVCEDTSSFILDASLTGATDPPYNVEITAPDGNNMTFSGLSNGLNSLKITDIQNGTYTLTKAGDNSCSNSANDSIELTVNPLPEVNLSGDTTACAGSTVPITYEMEGTAPFEITYIDGTGNLQTINAGTNQHIISTTTGGTYTLVDIQDANNCKKSASESIDIIYTPGKTLTASITPEPNEVCEGTSLPAFTVNTTNEGNAPLYEWTLNGTEVTSNETYIPGNSLSAGNYTIGVTVSSTEECIINANNEVSAFSTLTINPNPDNTVTGDSIYCPGFTTDLTATSPGISYEWTDVNSGNLLGTDQTLSVGSSMDVVVVLTDHNNCKSTSEVIQVRDVQNNNPVIISNKGDTICEGSNTTLQVSGASAESYTWSVNGTTLPSGDDFLLATQPGTYKVEMLLGGNCTQNVSFDLKTIPKPSPSIDEAGGIICEGETYPLSVNSLNSVVWYRDGIKINNATGNIYNASISGIYYAEEQNKYCSGISRPVQVKVEPVPDADAGEDQYISEGASANLKASGGEVYKWKAIGNTGNFKSPDNLHSVIVKPKDSPVHYEVTAYNASGNCSDKDTTAVFVELDLYPFNSLTANNDGANDFWKIINIDNFPNAHVKIYNRWGNLVWFMNGGYINDGVNCWRGTNIKGAELPIATYYYVIFPNGENNSEPLKGYITLLR